MQSDMEIARSVRLLPIEEIGAKISVPSSALYRYGPYKAKLSGDFIRDIRDKKHGKLVLVTAITPTPAGEGKTTTSIGLADALNSLGHKTILCLREPSLGPCFGMKGGATGGGRAQVAPMDEINLHFTGDIHAVTSANNLLSAMIDNHIYWGNALGINPSKVSWRRVMDMNDRALRHIVVALGNNGQVREDGFDITVASEIMAILCLARSLPDLQERLGKIIVGRKFDKTPVTAENLSAAAPMAALLRDAFQPNLVQTLEHNPVFIHGGPFANIAHGCNSLIATETALRLAEYTITEAGFGADLGAEKFFNIKCRQAGITPNAAVIVATVRALKMHGGISKDKLTQEDVEAVSKGVGNLQRHLENLKKFGVPITVAINNFASDTKDEIEVIQSACKRIGVKAFVCKHWAEGSKGAIDLANEVLKLCESKENKFDFLYPENMPLAEKIRTIAKEIYRARYVEILLPAMEKLEQYEADGFRNLPVCMAKTQYSFSVDPSLRGAPDDHVVQVRDVRLSAGAGFVVALCGEIMTMPGLPRNPSAHRIYVNEAGEIEGLF